MLTEWSMRRGWFILLLMAVLANDYASAVEPVDATYYNLLRVSTSATQQDIRQAYKKLAVKLHPDKNRNQRVHDQFLKVSEAYETLKDSEKRLQYDLHGAHPTYARRYDSRSQSEYNNLYYNGLYADDLFVDNLSGKTYFAYLSEGFIFVNFYSPFCPPCQELAGQWKRLAESFKGLVKVAAVNCKYQNEFCYNVMRISSYPSLLFYEDGNRHRFSVYKGDRSYESLEKFVMSYVEKEVPLTYNELISPRGKLTAYIIGDSWLHKYTVARIALHLKGLVRVVKILDERLKKRLVNDDYNTVVVERDGHYRHISSTREADILAAITASFPALQSITMDQLANIRNNLRGTVDRKPWVIYFIAGDTDRLLAQKLSQKFPDVEFGYSTGELDCEKWVQLCFSLQVDEPQAWGLVKVGGAYERFYGKNNFQDISQFIERAKDTDNVQTLSLSEFNRIIDGDGGVWILAVIPYKRSWSHIIEPFTEASKSFNNIQFGLMMCRPNSAKYCNPIALNSPAIIVQNKTQRFTFGGQPETDSLVNFIETVMDTSGIELTESKFYEILDWRSTEHTWAIAFFPESCDSNCDQLKYEYKIVARKMVPIRHVKVGFLYCDASSKRFCDQSNIRSPILRVYPPSSSNSYVVQMLNMERAAYILEWLLGTLDISVQQLSRPTFIKTVLAPKPDLPLSDTSNMPWLVYFHSPRCYKCYEMYTDFFIVGMMLKHRVKLGKVNCLQEREICNHEQITSYPSIKLYIKNTFGDGGTRSIHFVPKHYETMLREVQLHLTDEEPLSAQHFGKLSLERATPSIQHDEF